MYSKSLYSSELKQEYSSTIARHGGFNKIKKPEECKKDCERCYVEDDVCEWIEYRPGNWLWDYIKHQAIIRFFEIWGNKPRSNNKIYRGLGVDTRRESSVAGMLSKLFQAECIDKNKNGDWIYKGKKPDAKQYQRINPLNPSAIAICQQVAKQFSLSTKGEKEE